MPETKFQLQTFKGKPNKKENGWIVTNNYSLEVQRTVNKSLQEYLQRDYLEALATGN